jgi:Na+/H+ antiporter NhaB
VIEEKLMINRYAVYQLDSDDDRMRDMYFMSSAEIEAISDDYVLVATIDANDLEQAFTIGNIWAEKKINVVAPMRSVSVGDIIEDLVTGKTFVVANIGFDEINMKESV